MGKGYPYGLDNNESYSSWWHARSLYENGVSQTKGLTDEVFSTSPDASPFIHSHQGNFPRLFTFVVYALGFRSIESHILISTFTVGLAAILLAFRFLAELTRPAFATVACVVMMTNYLLFAQWQVSLYNVWHAFFFFSSLRCIQLLEPWSARRGRWLLLTTANFAALFYWEYVFTAFLTVLCALYALSLHWRRPALVALAAGAVAAGALLAAGTLLMQLTAYMGWSNVLEDIRLTLTARNTASDPAMLERVTTFYREQKIIFWHNFFDAAPLRTPAEFWNSIGRNHLAYYSGALAAPMVIFFVAGTLVWFRRWLPPLESMAATESHSPATPRTIALSAVAWIALTGVLTSGLEIIGPPVAGHFTSATSGLLAALAILVLGRVSLGSWWSWGRFDPRDLTLGWAFVLLSSSALAWLMPQVATPGTELGHWDWTSAGGSALRLGATGLGFWWILRQTPASASVRAGEFHRLFGFFLASLVAYAFTYRIFTGYVFSGYLHRLVPLLVFVTDLLLALVVFVAGQAVGRLRSAPSAGTNSPSPWVRGAALAAAGIFGAALTFQWASLQVRALALVRPDAYAFLRVLDKPEFRGKSVVSNAYPAPMAARTLGWGYADPIVFSGLLTLGPEGYHVDRDLKYLWMADQATNPDYLKPDLAVSVLHPPNVSEAWQRRAEREEREAQGLSRVPPAIARRAQSSFQPFLQHRMVYSDQDRIDIVRLDWDYPPFLLRRSTEIEAVATQLSLAQKLALSRSASEARRRWRVEWSWLEGSTPPLGEVMTIVCDDRPVDLNPQAAAAILHGDQLRIRLARVEGAGRLRLTVNESSEVIDPTTLPADGVEYTWSASRPLGNHTRSTPFAPGFYVNTKLVPGPGTSERAAELSYVFRHQSGREEAGTVIRRYQSDSADRWGLADTVHLLGRSRIPIRLDQFRRENPDTVNEHHLVQRGGDRRTYEEWLADHLAATPADLVRPGIARDVTVVAPQRSEDPTMVRFHLGPKVVGTTQFSVTPGTRSKGGPEYFGLPFPGDADALGDAVAIAPPAVDATGTPAYGPVRLKVRFPRNRWPQSEPLVTTGGNEAGDVLYVIYHDADHVRIGLDHWFYGGPLTAPLRIDFDREYELEISLGSLYPPADDVVFTGRSDAQVTQLKRRVVVRLDGVTLIDAASDFYESDPAQLRIGRNEIRATSCGPLFTGEIRLHERLWPEFP